MTTSPLTWLMEERGLDGELLARMDVRNTVYEGLGDVVAFTYRRDGEMYAAKFRSPTGKDWRSTRNVTRGLYNADALRHDFEAPVVITEGEIDALSVIQAGFFRAVSLPDGWTKEGNKRDCLVEAAEDLSNAPFVVVAGDNDEAGESLPRVVASILEDVDVRAVAWPKGCKDANDVLVRLGEEALAGFIQDARRVDPPGGFITGLSDLPPLSERRVLTAPHPLISERLALECGAMSVGTGTPGAGKSTFTTWAAYHIAMHERIVVGFLSFETHPHRTRDHLSRLHMGLPFEHLVGPQRQRFLEQMDLRFRLVHRTYEDGTSHALGWLRSMVRKLAVMDGCKLIIIDPWNELEHLPEPGESLTNYINFALQQIRQWAEKWDTHICVIAHPKKMETGHKPRPPLGYDIADSAAFANKPALGFTVHGALTDQGTPYTEIYTWKVRDTVLYGIEKGRSEASFDRDTMSYTSIDL